MADVDIDRLVDRYQAAWGEADEQKRRELVAEVWSPDGRYAGHEHEFIGHDGIAAVLTKNYEDFISNGFTFKVGAEVIAHHGTVRLTWDLIQDQSGQTVSVGEQIILLAEDGRIATEYQYMPTPPQAS
jgi:hypothetical protein